MCAHAPGNDLAFLYSRAGMAQLVGGGGGGGGNTGHVPHPGLFYTQL